MSGPDGMHVQYSIHGNLIVNQIGSEHSFIDAASLGSNAAGNEITALLEKPLAAPIWAVQMDVRKVAQDGLSFLRRMMGPMGAMLPDSIPTGDPVPMSMVASSDGIAWDQVRMRTNLKDWYTMIMQLQAEAAKMRAAEMKRMREMQRHDHDHDNERHDALHRVGC